jgi:UPF0755 protein
MSKRKIKTSFYKKVLYLLLTIALISIFAIGFDFYKKMFLPNVNFNQNEKNYVYVPTGITYPQFLNLLVAEHKIFNSATFDWMAQRLDLTENLHPGRYAITPYMDNLSLVKLLRSGKQTAVNFTFVKFRKKNDLVSFTSKNLEADSLQLNSLLNNSSYLDSIGFTAENAMTLFIPNSYQLYWNTSAREFITHMKSQYDKFWNTQRRSEADSLHLNTIQISILASLIDEETNMNTEKPEIASVYLNRLRSGMKLESDPTVRFAMNDFLVKRIYKKNTEINSPYNTYKNEGLPPGPICTPSITSIDAVLHAAKTNYLFFCASTDKPGYHVFASTYSQHEQNAKRYQQWLDAHNIQ